MLDEENQRFIAGEKIINLSKKETQLLSLLIQNKGKVVTYDDISDYIYGENGSDNNAIRSTMVRLKQRLGSSVEIKTVTGKGYMI